MIFFVLALSEIPSSSSVPVGVAPTVRVRRRRRRRLGSSLVVIAVELLLH